MRVSKRFKLGRTQPTLDFVDVDYNGDTGLFISPKALANLPSDWGDQCVSLVQSFFSTVLAHITAGHHGEAERLLKALREPNETHLGLSTGKSRGRALGDSSAHDVWNALSNSQAASSGLIRDLEDTVLLIPGIGVDVISDMTTNIIRGPLIDYTQRMAAQYGIELSPDVPSGPIWNPTTKDWFEEFVDLPMTPQGKLLLVPKAIVRRHLAYNLGEYYRFHVLTHLQDVELRANSQLVQITKKTKKRFVTKKDVEEKYGNSKKMVAEITVNNPSLLDDYKQKANSRPYLPLDHDLIAATEGTPKPDWDALLQSVLDIPTGNVDAKRYETAVESLFTALFYPDLTNPVPQSRIHDGRKIIDIDYTNMAKGGFFNWLSKHYPSGRIFVECKNYGGKVANPEMDQLARRFSPSRGQVGILVCRSFADKARFATGCRDTAKDGGGYIIALDDKDLKALVHERKTNGQFQAWTLLSQKFRALTD
ncbi:MAG: hypothetical protein ACOH1H_01340 [Brevundimonas sp.]